MTSTRPVRYRCELAAQIQLTSETAPLRSRLLELSEAGAFIEEIAAMAQVQLGDTGIMTLALPDQNPWVCRFRFTRLGTTQISRPAPQGTHLSVGCRGFGIEFEPMPQAPTRDRLRALLAVLDNA